MLLRLKLNQGSLTAKSEVIHCSSHVICRGLSGLLISGGSLFPYPIRIPDISQMNQKTCSSPHNDF